MKTKYFAITVVTFMALLMLSLSSARSETINCISIESVPFTISSQGVYCLTHDLTTSITSGSAITISTNNVSIDMNGFKLGGMGAGQNSYANGIYASQRQNISIRNGTIRGFYNGIFLEDTSPYTISRGHIIEDVRADGNLVNGINVQGTGMTIRNNQVVSTGGHTTESIANGIIVFGNVNTVMNNTLSDTFADELAPCYGIMLNTADGSVVESNRILNQAEVQADSYGIAVDGGSADVYVGANTVRAADFGINYLNGSTGIYRDNTTLGVTTPFTGGTNGGGNVF